MYGKKWIKVHLGVVKPASLLAFLFSHLGNAFLLNGVLAGRTSAVPVQCKFFRINTCKSVSKQMTLTPFKMNTYEKTGGEGGSTQKVRTGHIANRIDWEHLTVAATFRWPLLPIIPT